jgi:hypothetical protein
VNWVSLLPWWIGVELPRKDALSLYRYVLSKTNFCCHGRVDQQAVATPKTSNRMAVLFRKWRRSSQGECHAFLLVTPSHQRSFNRGAPSSTEGTCRKCRHRPGADITPAFFEQYVNGVIRHVPRNPVRISTTLLTMK